MAKDKSTTADQHLSSELQVNELRMNLPTVPIPIPQNDPRRIVPGRGAQAPYMNPVLPGQVPGYGISPGVGYGVAPGGLAQPGYAGLGQAGLGQAGMGTAATLPHQQVNPGLASSYYNQPMQQQALQGQPMQTPMGQGVAPGTTPGGAATGAAAPQPNTTGTDQYTPPSERHHRHSHHRDDEHHKIRDILRDLLAGTALAAIGEHHHRKKHRDASPSKTVDPQQPLSQQPPPPHAPHGSALGFLHPKGHFVPASLENMIEYFVHGNKEKGIAPDGARPGYLHTGGHFIPAGMEHLIEEFKHTLLYGPGARHNRGGKRRDRARSPSQYSGSESYSD